MQSTVKNGTTHFWVRLFSDSSQYQFRWIAAMHAVLVFPDIITSLMLLVSLLSWRCWTVVRVLQSWKASAVCSNAHHKFERVTPTRYYLFLITAEYYQQALIEIVYVARDFCAIVAGVVVGVTVVRLPCLVKNFRYAAFQYAGDKKRPGVHGAPTLTLHSSTSLHTHHHTYAQIFPRPLMHRTTSTLMLHTTS